ncbi:hypothetical protein RJ639_046594 [Escallonia herrerae]|uniref:NAC domain-containing protein n=1 Tax=Escallonia herrerae TaxID=1293975 RepID=A0AA89AZP5_9ASTE|nr:hypothetical protein RJ639_046594 [Escallonia herrerae]
MDETASELVLPGFRFHPTEEELLNFYLKNMVFGKKVLYDVIGFLNIYHHDPWDLPGKHLSISELLLCRKMLMVFSCTTLTMMMNLTELVIFETGLAKNGEREWYFFVPRDRKHGSGGRPNRTTENGFWKATGSDRKILSLSDPKRIIGLKKTLVFYTGRAPRGCKTDWVMNEYRLPDSCPTPKDVVLCKIYRKATSLKVLEQRAAMEEDMKTTHAVRPPSPLSPPTETISFCNQHDDLVAPRTASQVALKKEDEELLPLQGKMNELETERTHSSTLSLPTGTDKLELQLPRFSMDWSQDPFCAQLHSPWLDNWMSYANVIDF